MSKKKHKLHYRDIGEVFVATLQDHTENIGRTVVVEAVGRLIGYDDTELHLRAWNILDDPNRTVDGRMEFAICRKVVQSLRKLR